jgi:hypothetical protein
MDKISVKNWRDQKISNRFFNMPKSAVASKVPNVIHISDFPLILVVFGLLQNFVP